jgi:MATE family multidrug resistance protein
MASYREIGRRALPLILANSAVPLLGLADTAIIGNFGTVTDLGAIAFGALIFSFVYWSFGFLRMGTTGFIAQAAGAEDHVEVRAVLGRALILALGLSLLILTIQWPIGWMAFQLLDGSQSVEEVARQYFQIRIWGAPATLCTFALVGLLIGLGNSAQLLQLQLFLNGLNIALDFLFAGVLEMGASGIALGTVIAEWLTLFYGGFIVKRQLAQAVVNGELFWPTAEVIDRNKILKMLSANLDIMVRTLILVFSFALFTNQSARFGDVTLAANHLLLQLISFSAFFLDGYAFVVEAMAGKAMGARDRLALKLSVLRTSVLALVTALVLALLIYATGEFALSLLTDIEAVLSVANDYKAYAALYVLVSFAAFQLDGIFIGVSHTREMRQAAIYSLLVFLVAVWGMAGSMGLAGLWWAMIVYVIARALALLFYYPRIMRTISAASGVYPQS